MAEPHPRRLRFGCEIHHPFEGRTWLDTFKEVEDLGYSSLVVPDHVHEGPGPLAAMASAAAATSELTVCALVLDCDFRHPAILARELATIDHLAEGRLEVGLGAGWKAEDYERTGIPMDPPGVRVSRMQEHVAVLQGLWVEGPFSFDGDHYQITELDGTPAPYTVGGPPLIIGGGAPRVLRFAGATADIVGVNASIHSGQIDVDAAHDGLAERIDAKVAWVREGAGDRFDQLELNAWLAVCKVTDEPMAVAEAIAPGFAARPDEVLDSPLVLVGSATDMAERLSERRERWGYSYHVVPGPQAHAMAPVVAQLTGT